MYLLPHGKAILNLIINNKFRIKNQLLENEGDNYEKLTVAPPTEEVFFRVLSAQRGMRDLKQLTNFSLFHSIAGEKGFNELEVTG